MIAPALFSSQSVEWATPPALFAKLAKRYGPFGLDVCATAENAKCLRYFDVEQDGPGGRRQTFAATSQTRRILDDHDVDAHGPVVGTGRRPAQAPAI